MSDLSVPPAQPATPKGPMAECPYCREPVRLGAALCPHCRSEQPHITFTRAVQQEEARKALAAKRKRGGITILIVLAVLLLGIGLLAGTGSY
jgi:predicted amidophosphoribosyltransferase